uniref:ATP-dependent DNA helicase n=1 Tax=Globodera rostochiensis TaxID=31243 RepID=A0A914H7G4_GLORO
MFNRFIQEGSAFKLLMFYLDDGSNVVPSNPYDVVLTGRFGSGKIHMKWSNRNIDPVLFPLLFSRGQCGFERGLALRLREGEHVDSHLLLRDAQQNIVPETDELGEEAEFLGPTNERVYNRRDKVSFAQWFRYMSQIRGANWRNPHWLWDWGTIAQLYTLTFNNRAEAQKVQYMKRKQGQRRLVLPNSLINWLEALRNKQGIDKTISQQTYRSLRLARPHWQFYQREYANCMTICREFGPPDLLVTFTMSPDFHPMATTGIAADLLYEGQTVHKRLCRAKHVDSSTALNVDYESNFAHMLRSIHGMIIDEISMQHREVLEYVDRLLRSVAPKRLENIPFAGKVVVLGGDWKQLAPVIPGGGHLDQKNASVKSSTLFKHFTTIRLTANHRLQAGQGHYRNFLMRVGSGLLNNANLRIKLPTCMVEPDRDALINFVFPPEILKDPIAHWAELEGRAILCPLNRETLELNNIIMDRLPTRERAYTGFTTPITDETTVDVGLQNNVADVNYENLSRLTPPGIPEHHLRVKVGAVMMIITNISLEEGLCNGTRVQIVELFTHIIRCRILTGTHRGNTHDLHVARFLFGGDPRAPHEGLLRCERIQFPLRPGSVMTINKAQGQTLSHVGILLDRSQCFAHGQLYVALSRVRQAENIKVCTKRPDRLVKNIVMTDLLDPVDHASPTAADTTIADDPPPEENELPINHEHTSRPSPSLSTPTTRTSRQSSASPVTLNLAQGVTRDLLRKLVVVKGDITNQHAFMITTQSTEHAALNLRCYALELQDHLEAFNGALPAGTVVVTPAYGDLRDHIEYIAHAVAPVALGSTPTTDDIAALKNCYSNALDHLLATEIPPERPQPRTIAFPCISTGAKGFNRATAANLAFEAVLNWLAEDLERAAEVPEIHFVMFANEDYLLYLHQNTVRCANNVGLGDCFYRAIVISLFGSDSEVISDLLRVATSRQLSSILQNAKYFPRQQYATHNAFLEHLQLALLDIERLQWFDQNLEACANYIAMPFRKNGGWAQLDDAYMVAILLRRTVAIVHPNATRDQLQAHAAQWNDSNQYPQIVDVYFPDGIARRAQNNMPLEDLQQFTLICDNGLGQLFERQVTNPIVVWYNGLNHFETIVLPPSGHKLLKEVSSSRDTCGSAKFQQIHPGRLGVQTVDGSRLVAQFYLDDGSNVVPSTPYDVVLTGRFGSGKRHMKWSNRNIDPALFPLLFSRGQCGFALRLREGEHVDSHLLLRDAQQNIVPETDELGEEAEFLGPTNERVYNRRDKVSFAQWFRYMSQIRGANWRNPHWLWDWGTIAQLYTLTFNNRAEAQKVQYMKRKQGQRRLVLPNSLINWLEALRNKQGIALKQSLSKHIGV